MAEADFEVPLSDLQKRIDELQRWPGDPDKEQQARKLREELDARRREVYSHLTPWQKTLVARHPNRPYTLDYVQALCADWTELRGDRRYADDPALVCGFALFHELPVCIVGHQKGRDTKQKIHRNFGMPKPEGYRKAMRVMELAAKFSRPILSFVDTPGAYPGIDAEERGQAEAIAYNLREMAGLRTPIIVTVTGEGGSGGALAIAVGDRVNMLEHSVYSVISPEGCASILFRDASRAEQAATAMKITAADLKAIELVDEVIAEPPGGAHVDHDATFRAVDTVLWTQLQELVKVHPERLPGDALPQVPRDGAARARVPRSDSVSLPVDVERLRRQFPALTDEDVAAWETITRRVLADPRARGSVLADVMSAAQRAREKQAAGLDLEAEEALGLSYVQALAKMQPGRG